MMPQITWYVLYSGFLIHHYVNNMFVNLPNKSTVTVTHIGTIVLTNGLTLKNVLYVPHFTYNMIFTSKLIVDETCCIMFHNDHCLIQVLPSMMIGTAKQHFSLYHLM